MVSDNYEAFKRYKSRQCHFYIHKGNPEIEGAALAPFILATIFFMNRIAAKYMRLGGAWGPDDFTIIVAWVRVVAIS